MDSVITSSSEMVLPDLAQVIIASILMGSLALALGVEAINSAWMGKTSVTKNSACLIAFAIASHPSVRE